MNRVKVLRWATIACSLLMAGCQNTDSPGKPDKAQVEIEQSEASAKAQEELKQASQEWDRLYNSGDVDNLVALYAEDTVSMPPGAPTISGREALQADFKGFFSKNVARHETMVDKVLIEGDLALEVARYKLTFKPREGGAEVVETGRHMETRRKIDGQWKIILEIWNSDSPAPK